MTREEKAQATLNVADTARECAAVLNRWRPSRLTPAGDKWFGPELTTRTIRKARQGRRPALLRIADALGYQDDAAGA